MYETNATMQIKQLLQHQKLSLQFKMPTYTATHETLQYGI